MKHLGYSSKVQTVLSLSLELHIHIAGVFFVPERECLSLVGVESRRVKPGFYDRALF